MRFKVGVVLLAIVILAAGCVQTKPLNSTAGAATPEEAVNSMFASLKKADAPAFNAVVQYKRTNENGIIFETERFFGDSLDDESKTYILAVFEELNYTVLSSSEQTDGQKIFTLEITNKDLSGIGSFDYVNSDNFLLAQANAVKKITNTVTNTIEIYVVHSENGWQVVIDDNLRNALWGNKQGMLHNLRNFLP